MSDAEQLQLERMNEAQLHQALLERRISRSQYIDFGSVALKRERETASMVDELLDLIDREPSKPA